MTRDIARDANVQSLLSAEAAALRYGEFERLCTDPLFLSQTNGHDIGGGLPDFFVRARQRGAAFAITRASRRARTRSIGSRRCSLPTIPPPSLPPPSPGPARYLVPRDHGLPAFRNVHLLVNVLHRDLLVSARSLALKREQALLIGG
jgi:hypothetical protein